MKNICIITPSIDKYSETFIQNQIKYLPFNKSIVTTDLGEFADENGVPLAAQNFIAKLRRFIGRKFLNQNFETQQNKVLARYLLRNKVEHVLFQYGTTAKKGYCACVHAAIPYTIHFHGYDAYTYKFTANFYGQVIKFANSIVVVSNDMKKRLLELGAEKNRINIIPCGASIANKKHDLKEKESHKEIKLVSVGRFVEKKAPYLTILSFYFAYKENSNLTLRMVGEGELLNVCKNLVYSLGLENSVKFLGKLNHDEVLDHIVTADYFIQHSITAENGDKEGMPVAIMEALSLKTPVISTFHSGIPEIVKDGINGLLSKELDIQGMANNIIKLTDHDFSFPEIEFLRLENSIKQLADVLNGY